MVYGTDAEGNASLVNGMPKPGCPMNIPPLLPTVAMLLEMSKNWKLNGIVTSAEPSSPRFNGVPVALMSGKTSQVPVITS